MVDAMPPPTAARIHPLEGRQAVGTISLAPPASRISLRAPAESIGALSKALGLKLPDRPKCSIVKGPRSALWLGPDEWLVIDEDGADLMGACAGIRALHSAVDVSHRNVGILLDGPHSEAMLSAGCPQDLSLAAFPVGSATRTVLGKVEIVLLRSAPDSFRVEVWRSFSDYAFTLLVEASREIL